MSNGQYVFKFVEDYMPQAQETHYNKNLLKPVIREKKARGKKTFYTEIQSLK